MLSPVSSFDNNFGSAIFAMQQSASAEAPAKLEHEEVAKLKLEVAELKARNIELSKQVDTLSEKALLSP
jgi:cell division protein FtsB